MSTKKPITPNTQFGLLTFVSYALGYERPYGNFTCSCGVAKAIRISHVLQGRTVSCGHKGKSGDGTRTHGLSRTKIYGVWLSMRRRCSDPKNKRYAEYGGRGIKVCERWQSSFEAFIADMGDRPAGAMLERKDSNGDYEPNNCCWASQKQQQRNRRNTIKVTLCGRTQSLAAWIEEFGIDSSLAHSRYYAGWKPEEILLPPLRPHARENGSFKRKRL